MGNGSELIFFRRHTKGQQVFEKVLNITTHQGNAIETTLRYHLTSVRMVVIKKTRKKKYCKECRKKGTFAHCFGECKLVVTMGKIM